MLIGTNDLILALNYHVAMKSAILNLILIATMWLTGRQQCVVQLKDRLLTACWSMQFALSVRVDLDRHASQLH
jgi:hypothetical protein